MKLGFNSFFLLMQDAFVKANKEFFTFAKGDRDEDDLIIMITDGKSSHNHSDPSISAIYKVNIIICLKDQVAGLA